MERPAPVWYDGAKRRGARRPAATHGRKEPGMRYQHLVFDLDGTLLDTEQAILASLRDTIRGVQGRELPEEALTFALGIPGADALAQLAVRDVPAALALWERELRQYAGSVRLFNGVQAMLEQAARRGYRLGIVTSKTRAEFRQEFVPFGVAGLFGTVICADDTREHKPHPAPLLAYLDRTGAQAGQLLYLGDSRYDCACAAGAGVDFALAGWGTREPGLPAAYRPAAPAELLPLLEAEG